jgi:tetratricopeptide (TPR) repeat protein
MRERRWIFAALAMLLSVSLSAQQPDYEATIALRTSRGFRAALEAAAERLSSDSNDGVAHAVTAFVYANGGDYLAMGSEAAERKTAALREAIRWAPSAPFTRAARGLIRMTSDTNDAENALRQCLRDTPEFLECHNLYGDLLRKTGRPERAGEVYRSAIERWPNDGELQVSLALQLQETGASDQGVEILEALTETQPNFPRGHWHRATMLYETGGDRARAREAAVRALELDPLIWNGSLLLRLLDATTDDRP